MLPKKKTTSSKIKVEIKPKAGVPDKPSVKKEDGEKKSGAAKKKGLSLKQILRSTPPYYKNSAVDVRINNYRKTTSKAGRPAIAATTYSVTRAVNKRVKYKTSIIGLDVDQDTPIYKQERVLVSCSCEDYCYTWEYANWVRGASNIRYSNGEPAVFKNPSNLAGACKHLVALAVKVMEEKD